MSNEICLHDEVRQGGRTLGYVIGLLGDTVAIEYENGDVHYFTYQEARQLEFWDAEACDWTPYEG